MILYATFVHATVYYVDAGGGDDDNPGTEMSAPWKTLAKVASQKFSPGDRILFKRGEIWKGPLVFTSSGTEGAPILLGAYGEGDKPVISVNWEYHGNWIRESNNIWKVADINFQPWRVRINGEEKLQTFRKEDLDGVTYFWYIETDDVIWDVKEADLYLYSTVPPDSLLIQLNAVPLSFHLANVHDVVVRDLDIQGGNDGCFMIEGSHNIRLVHDNIGKYARFGITLYNVHDVVIDSCRVDAHYEFFYDVAETLGPQDGITTWGSAENLEVKNSTIRTWGHNCIYLRGHDNFVVTENKVHDCLLEGDNSYSRAFETGGNAHHNEFYNNIVRRFKASCQVGGTNNFYHHNIFYDLSSTPVYDYPIGQAITFQQFEGGPDMGNRIENNVFADIDDQALNYIAGGQWCGTIKYNTFKNNILYNTGRNPRYSSERGVAIKWPSCDAVEAENYSNNCIYNPGGEAWIIYRGTRMSVEEFNSQNGSHGDTIGGNISVDPFFVDVRYRDYHLTDSSPCIDAGIVIPGMEKDFDGSEIPYGEGPDIGAYEYHPLVSYLPFLDYDCIGTGYEGYATSPSAEPYVPRIIIDEKKIIYVSPGGGGDGSSEDHPTTFATAFQQATPGTTILALDGEYKINLSVPAIHDVNIISKNKWGARINCGSDNALDLGNRRDIHHINIIGFEVYGDEGGEFIFAAGDAKDIGTHHFYLSDMKFHDLKMGLYTGLHSHDWTVDRCMYYDSRMSYLWYMMGWHQTVMNSVMFNNTYYSLAIRGHYPLDEEFDYFNPENNTPITDRKKSWLEPDDWTHKIINNTFGSCTNTSRPGETHVSIFYNKPAEDPPLQSEDVYFPPQNITIANNAFIDNGPINKKPVVIFAERGINTGEPWSVNGVYIFNNVTDKNKILVQEDYPIESIDLSQNTLNAKHIEFADAAAHDYRLTAASTDLIDRGSIRCFVPNTDFRGNSRDDPPDVGAYEYFGIPAGTGGLRAATGTLRIYPNPADDHIHIEFPGTNGNGEMVIYNDLARKVRILLREERKKTEINIQDLEQGLYFCRYFDSREKKVYCGKFIVFR